MINLSDRSAAAPSHPSSFIILAMPLAGQIKRSKKKAIDNHIIEMNQRIAKGYVSRLSSTGSPGEIKNRIIELFDELEGSNDATALTYMISRYFYSIRNATFHGETPCPVYPHEKRRPCDVWIEDLLESTILDLASLISERNCAA